jgi:hypothetical protein
LDKPSGEMRFPAEVSVCDHYDWVQGFYRVSGGTFTINDLVDNGIFGTISVTSGELNIHQDAGQFIDLNGTLFISSGICNVFGGGYESFWSYADDASITMSGGVLDFVDNGIRIYNTAAHAFSENISGGTIRTSHNFKIYRNNFAPTGGLIQLYGTPDAGIIQVAGSSFNNLEIDKSSKNYISGSIIPKSRDGEEIKSGKSNAVIANTDLDINGDFTLSAGNFSAPGRMTVAGDWINNVDPDAFFEEFGTVVFDGATDQNCYEEQFYTLELDKSGGYLIFKPGEDITCVNYDWTQGGFWVQGADVVFYDLTDDGIYGNIYITGGQLSMIQGTSSGEYVDLNGDITISGGSIDIYGGIDDSFWSYNGDASLNMTGGHLGFADVGIRVLDDPGFTFTENITSGFIHSNGNLIIELADFNPEDYARFYMDGSTDVAISMVSGSSIPFLDINKYSKEGNNSYKKIPRIKMPMNNSKANMVTAISDIKITMSFTILDGIFSAPAKMYVGNDWNNSQGEAAFIENTGTVIFNGHFDSYINHHESFYNLKVDKINSGYEVVVENDQDIEVLNDLLIIHGILRTDVNNNLDIEGHVLIEGGEGWYAGNADITVGGNWYDFNDSDMGFIAEYSTLTFDGPGDQTLHSDFLYAEFNNLIINKTGGTGMDTLVPFTNVRVYGNIEVQEGVWYDLPAGNNHLIFGDILIGSEGEWIDTDGTVSFVESNTQSFINDGNCSLDVLSINKESSTDQVNITGNIIAQNLNVSTGSVSINSDYFIDNEGILVESNGNLVIEPGTILRSQDGANIIVAAGGKMTLNGTATQHCIISENGEDGYYNFDVYGELSADYTQFKFMTADGINIHPGAVITSGHAFNNCVFSYGESGGTYLTINNDQILTIDGIIFNQNNWGGNSNVSKTQNTGNVTFTNFTGDFSGEAYDDDVFDRIIWDEGIREIDVKVFLEGPFFGGTMLTALNIQGIIPNGQPYNVPPWNYPGTESVPNIPNTDIVDWVLMEYRDAPSAVLATSSTIIGKQAAFLLSNGNIVDIDGSSLPGFPYSLSDGLFVVIYQRNHLALMSAVELSEDGGVYTYDFSISQGQAYGTNSMKNLGGIYGMFGGDSNGSGLVNTGDLTNDWKPQAGKNGYLSADYKLDGQIDNKDKNDIWNSNNGKESQVPN